MSRRRVLSVVCAAAIVAASLLVASGPASAYDNCTDGTIGGVAGSPSMKGQRTFEVGFGNALYYVNVREVAGDKYEVAAVWLYKETNGIPGLQRGGTSLLGDRDSCQESDDPDLLIA